MLKGGRKTKYTWGIHSKTRKRNRKTKTLKNKSKRRRYGRSKNTSRKYKKRYIKRRQRGGSPEVLWEGVLKKNSANPLRKWTNRLFKLDEEGKFTYYKEGEEKGSFDLKNYKVLDDPEMKSFTLKPNNPTGKNRTMRVAEAVKDDVNTITTYENLTYLLKEHTGQN